MEQLFLLIPGILIVCIIIYFVMFHKSYALNNAKKYKISLQPSVFTKNTINPLQFYFKKIFIDTNDVLYKYNDSYESIENQWQADKRRLKLRSSEIDYLENKPNVYKYFIQTINAILFSLVNDERNYYELYKLKENERYMPKHIRTEYNDFLNENNYLITYIYLDLIVSPDNIDYPVNYILSENKYIVSKYTITVSKDTEELENITVELYTDKFYEESNINNSDQRSMSGGKKKQRRRTRK